MFAADCPTKRAAFMTDMTLGRWSHVPAISILTDMARGQALNRTAVFSLHGCRNLETKFGHFRLVQLHQNLPQYFRRNHVADSILIFWIISPKPCRRCIWIVLSKPRRRSIIFDDDLGHGNHSGELLLFVGCIVNFVVSYLICMFQDSVPAESYNDPINV